MRLEAGVRIDRYLLERPLGEGGQAEIWKATDLVANDICALKIVDVRGSSDAHLERLRREARALARLRHPSLCHCRGLFEDFDRQVLGLGMDFVEGRSLREVANTGELNDELRLAIVGHLAGALAYVHDHGVVHRDLKPENILLAETFSSRPHDPATVRLVDFGVASQLRRGQRLTQPGEVLGTPAYMAPEQLEPSRWGVEGAIPAMDVFALGVIAWELFGGRHPTELPDTAVLGEFAIAYRAADGAWAPEPPPTMPAGHIWRRAVELRASARYASAGELLAELSQILGWRSTASVLGDGDVPRAAPPAGSEPPVIIKESAKAPYRIARPGFTEKATEPYLHQRDVVAAPLKMAPRRTRDSARVPPLAVLGAVGIGIASVGALVAVAWTAEGEDEEPPAFEVSAPRGTTSPAPVVATVDDKPPPVGRPQAIVVPICDSHTNQVVGAPLRDAPGMDTRRLRYLSPGTEVTLGKREVTPIRAGKSYPDTWYEVFEGDLRAGWMHTDVLHSDLAGGPRAECNRCPRGSSFCAESCTPIDWTGRFELYEACGRSAGGSTIGFSHVIVISERAGELSAVVEVSGWMTHERVVAAGRACGDRLLLTAVDQPVAGLGPTRKPGERLLVLRATDGAIATTWEGHESRCEDRPNKTFARTR